MEQYLGKGFVEKGFRTWKSGIEEEPDRHRHRRRVRAYLIVCNLACRLEMALRWRLLKGRVKLPDVGAYQERLLEDLSRVERAEVRIGAQSRTRCLNVTGHIQDALRPLKTAQLLEEKPREPTPAIV